MQQGQVNVPSRVVVLTRQKDVGEHVRRRIRSGDDWVLVNSPYEAAAEVLAEPTAAVVMDLRLLSPRDERLVQIARTCGTAMLGIGALPAGMSTDTLSGIVLVSLDCLDSQIDRALENHPRPEVHRATLTNGELDDIVSCGSEENDEGPNGEAAPDDRPRPVRPDEIHRERNESLNRLSVPQLDPLEESRFVPEPSGRGSQPATPTEALLSDEELAALLERDL